MLHKIAMFIFTCIRMKIGKCWRVSNRHFENVECIRTMCVALRWRNTYQVEFHLRLCLVARKIDIIWIFGYAVRILAFRVHIHLKKHLVCWNQHHYKRHPFDDIAHYFYSMLIFTIKRFFNHFSTIFLIRLMSHIL